MQKIRDWLENLFLLFVQVAWGFYLSWVHLFMYITHLIKLLFDFFAADLVSNFFPAMVGLLQNISSSSIAVWRNLKMGIFVSSVCCDFSSFSKMYLSVSQVFGSEMQGCEVSIYGLFGSVISYIYWYSLCSC